MRYYVVEDGGGPEDNFKVPKAGEDRDLTFTARYCAEDYHSNHDGWEASWPLTFVILDEDLNELGCFLIDREAIPQFNIVRKDS
jgi:hypothetical protein